MCTYVAQRQNTELRTHANLIILIQRIRLAWSSPLMIQLPSRNTYAYKGFCICKLNGLFRVAFTVALLGLCKQIGESFLVLF